MCLIGDQTCKRAQRVGLIVRTDKRLWLSSVGLDHLEYRCTPLGFTGLKTNGCTGGGQGHRVLSGAFNQICVLQLLGLVCKFVFPALVPTSRNRQLIGWHLRVLIRIKQGFERQVPVQSWSGLNWIPCSPNGRTNRCLRPDGGGLHVGVKCFMCGHRKNTRHELPSNTVIHKGHCPYPHCHSKRTLPGKQFKTTAWTRRKTLQSHLVFEWRALGCGDLNRARVIQQQKREL